MCIHPRLRYCRLSFESGAFVGVHVTCETSGIAKSTMAYCALRTISILSCLLLLCRWTGRRQVACRLAVLVGVEFFAALRARTAEVPSKVNVVSKLTWLSISPHPPQKRACGAAAWPQNVQKTGTAAGRIASRTSSRSCALHIDRIQK